MAASIISNKPGRDYITSFAEIGLQDIRALGRYQLKNAIPPRPLHTHSGAIEILYVVKGTQWVRVPQSRHFINANEVFITPPDTPHDSINHPVAPALFYWIILNIPTAGGTFLHLPPMEAHQLLQRFLAPHRLQAFIPEGCHTILDDILHRYHQPPRWDQTMWIRNRIILFLLMVADAIEQTPAGHILSEGIRAALDYIDMNIHDAMPNPVLAATAGLSPSRFYAKFKMEVGMTPTDYVRRQKVNAALELICRHHHSITDAAFALGFSSSQYFATVCKQYTGKTPQAHREGG
jgi:AraC-like DNA-binding protein/mannose-6-phosphate isomerase-like protein (cupin superfamily)